ncbi:MBL fold metallo-hydrolase [Paenibacillus daejeonensis]|uniref:MBL fold metallo-hydrolase n=1 Tax=Paenibacillus daejeonensis TaxID=135193 RepID=UPI000369F268|nr:MBL fold metallo-hydrolase [Paenibacillus daejeonensis]
MKLHYLGTGASEGFPAVYCECDVCERALQSGGNNIKRRSSVLINDRILMDVSPDLYMQKLKFGLQLARVESVVVTHADEDHFDVFSLMLRGKPNYCTIHYDRGGTRQVQVYGNQTVESLFYWGVKKKLRGYQEQLAYQRVEPFRAFEASGMVFTPLIANHRVDELCYIYMIEQGGKRVLYANDTDAIEERNYEAIRGLHFDLVSMDCARGILPGDGHMGLAENVEMKRKLEQYGCVNENTRYLLTHISHMCGMTHDELAIEAGKYGFELAYDGLILEL